LSAIERSTSVLRTHRRLLIAAVPPLLLAVTSLDGPGAVAKFAAGPAISVALTFTFWAVLWLAASNRLRRLMLVGLFAATLGEVVFSLGLGMYTYRQATVPPYVPPGHTILYASIFLFVRLPEVRRRARLLGPLLFLAGAAWSFALWRFAHDGWGFLCFGLFVVLLIAIRRSRLFFAAMYLLVAYLELCGTSAGAWAWPSHLLGRPDALASANPPSGVAVFYSLFDLSCLALYFGTRFTHFERWVARLVWRRSVTAPSPSATP